MRVDWEETRVKSKGPSRRPSLQPRREVMAAWTGSDGRVSKIP